MVATRGCRHVGPLPGFAVLLLATVGVPVQSGTPPQGQAPAEMLVVASFHPLDEFAREVARSSPGRPAAGRCAR
jgi:ABC-type Zn uptake system ZnuABC Zn-binding protein ZnuA